MYFLEYSMDIEILLVINVGQYTSNNVQNSELSAL